MFRNNKMITAVTICIILLLLSTVTAFGAANVGTPHTFSGPGGQIWCVAQEGDYAYTLNKAADGYPAGVYVYNVSDLTNIRDVTNMSNSDLRGSFNGNPGLFIRIYDGYLYAVFEGPNEIRRYNLANPADPQFVSRFTYSNSIIGFDIAGDYLYAGGWFDLTSINVNNPTVRYTLANTNGTRYIHYDNNKLYAARDGDGGRLSEVFSVDVTNPESMVKLGARTLSYQNASDVASSRVIQDVVTYNGYAYFTSYGSDWMKRKLHALDISDPENLETAVMYTYPDGEGLYDRINSLYAANNVLYGVDISSKIHMFDIRDPSNVIKLRKPDGGEFDISGNLYIMAKSGKLTEKGYVVAAAQGGGLRFYPTEVAEINITSPAASTGVTTRPVRVSGNVFGVKNVNVYFMRAGNSDWESAPYVSARVEPDGSYTAELNDDFLQNGVYSIKAVAVSDFSLTPQTSREYIIDGVSVNAGAPATFTESVLIDGQPAASLSAGGLSARLSVVNNSTEIKDAIFVTALYKNGHMVSSSYQVKDITAGEINYENSLTLSGSDASGSLQSYLIKDEGNNKYRLLWKSQPIGAAFPSVAPKGEMTVNNNLSIDIDSLHMQDKISVNASSLRGINKEILAIMLKPGATDISGLDNIAVVTADSAGKAAVELGMASPSQENQDYQIFISLKTDSNYLYNNDTIKYFGLTTVRPILDEIRTSQPGISGDGTIGKILSENAYLLAIDMGVDSEYSKLGDEYKGAVLEKIRGKDYVSSGVVALKNDFNNGVAAEKLLESVNTADSSAKLKSVIIENAAAIGVSVAADSIFSKLSDTAMEKLYNRMSAIRYRDVASVGENTITFSALEYVNQTAFSTLEEVISEVKNILSVTVSLPSRITDNSLAKQEFYRELGRLRDNAPFLAAANLQAAINEATTYIIAKYPETSGNINYSSTGGGGGGGSSVSIGGNIISRPTEPIGNKIDFTSFEDLGDAIWAIESIEGLAKREIVSGKAPNIFDPHSFVTREEFTKLVVLAFDINGGGDIEFSDVETGRWSLSFIKSAAGAGIINGVGDGLFMPEGLLTRQDMCVMLHRAMKYASYSFTDEEENSFIDADSISEYALDAVKALSGENIVNGYPDNSFQPFENANRAMAAKVIYEALLGIEAE